MEKKINKQISEIRQDLKEIKQDIKFMGDSMIEKMTEKMTEQIKIMIKAFQKVIKTELPDLRNEISITEKNKLIKEMAQGPAATQLLVEADKPSAILDAALSKEVRTGMQCQLQEGCLKLGSIPQDLAEIIQLEIPTEELSDILDTAALKVENTHQVLDAVALIRKRELYRNAILFKLAKYMETTYQEAEAQCVKLNRIVMDIGTLESDGYG